MSYSPLPGLLARRPLVLAAWLGLAAAACPASGEHPDPGAGPEGGDSRPAGEATGGGSATSSASPGATGSVAGEVPNPSAGASAGTEGGTRGQAPQDPSPTATSSMAKAVPFPTLDFVRLPGGTDAKQVALTFDDGPDGKGSKEGQAGRSNTAAVLDQLKALGLKGTFFLCSAKATRLAEDPSAIADVRRMIAEGHQLANHTADHRRCSARGSAPMSPEEAGLQLQRVQDAIADPRVLGDQAPRLTMYRMPYGVPYQGSTSPAGSDQADIKLFAPVTAKWGVHVGWGIDTHDWACATSTTPDKACVMTHLGRFLGAGSSGVILMHSTAKLSADVLPDVVAELKKRGYSFVMVEDFIKAKYGATSSELVAAANMAKFTDAQLIEAASKSANQSEWVRGINPD